MSSLHFFLVYVVEAPAKLWASISVLPEVGLYEEKMELLAFFAWCVQVFQAMRHKEQSNVLLRKIRRIYLVKWGESGYGQGHEVPAYACCHRLRVHAAFFFDMWRPFEINDLIALIKVDRLAWFKLKICQGYWRMTGDSFLNFRILLH